MAAGAYDIGRDARMPEICGLTAAAGQRPTGSAIAEQAGAENDNGIGFFCCILGAGVVDGSDEGDYIEQAAKDKENNRAFARCQRREAPS